MFVWKLGKLEQLRSLLISDVSFFPQLLLESQVGSLLLNLAVVVVVNTIVIAVKVLIAIAVVGVVVVVVVIVVVVLRLIVKYSVCHFCHL